MSPPSRAAIDAVVAAYEAKIAELEKDLAETRKENVSLWESVHELQDMLHRGAAE